MNHQNCDTQNRHEEQQRDKDEITNEIPERIEDRDKKMKNETQRRNTGIRGSRYEIM